jgi:gliding motility-associated-like protein
MRKLYQNLFLKTKGFYSLSLLLLLLATSTGFAQTTKTIGTSGADYPTLKAAFDAVNAGTISGAITLQVIDNTTETVSAVLNASGTGTASYTSILIYPTVTGKTISGSLSSPLIDLNGADNVTIDGRLNQTGVKDLTLSNTSTASTAGTSTIRLINDATANTLKYLNIKGSSMDTAGGIINFSTTIGTTGNDINTIDNNAITNALGARPINAIYSLGTATVGLENSENTISNNNIYDFLNTAAASNGLNLTAGTTAWTVTGNSFYETSAPFTSTAAVNYVIINITNVGEGFVVTNNYIGGSTASSGGTAWSKTGNNNNFTGILINAGPNLTANSIQGNTISNFEYTNSGTGTFVGLELKSGTINAGTISGNTIGSTTATDAIKYTSSNGAFYGIWISAIVSTGIIKVENNSVANITFPSTTAYSTINGIFKNGASTTVNIKNNTIKNITSLYTGTIGFKVYGIQVSTGSTTTPYGIIGNTISNISSSCTTTTTNSGYVAGILAAQKAVIQNNSISGITSKALQTSTTEATAMGIIARANADYIITGNTISNIKNTNTASGTTAVVVTGIYCVASAATSNIISGNFVSDLSVDASSTAANIYGIKVDQLITNAYINVNNNIVNIGGTTKSNLYGIYQTVGGAYAAKPTMKIYFNTVSISGTAPVNASSYALFSDSNSIANPTFASTRDYRDNIFSNTRNNQSAGTAPIGNYAVYFTTASNTDLTLDNNNYFVSGVGGTLGYYNGTNATILPIVTGNDTNSLTINPNFANATGTSAADFKQGTSLPGISITGITTDYYRVANTRLATPSMGALEANCPTVSSSLSPASQITGGNVIITGTNFAGVTGVKFNGITATYTVDSVTQITATVPVGATTGPITVTTTCGSSSSSTNFTQIVTPSFTYASPQVYTVGSAITALNPTVTSATGTVVYSVSPGLPDGLVLNTTTGAISGTPTADQAVTPYSITATNEAGSSSVTLSLNIGTAPSALSFTLNNSHLPVGIAITSLNPTITSGSGALTYSINPVLPTGLSLNTTTGVISGTPTVVVSNITYTITATSTYGSTTTTILFDTGNTPVFSYSSNINTFTAGTAITSLTPTQTVGTGVATYSVTPILPSGLNFNTSTGVISGTPAAGVALLSSSYLVRATNNYGFNEVSISIDILAQPTNLSYGGNQVYTLNANLTPVVPTVSANPAPTFSISPTLPTGLLFNTTTGAISGTPMVGQAAQNYTVTAANGISPNATVSFTITIQASPIVSYVQPGNYTVGTSISQLVPTVSGSNPITFSVNPALPSGLSLNTTTGVISGTPTILQTAQNYTVIATNSLGSGTFVLSINIQAPPTNLSYGSDKVYTINTAITPVVPTVTANPAPTFSISPTLPTGLSFNTSTGAISGTPTVSQTAQSYTVTAANGISPNATVSFTITIQASPIVSYVQPGNYIVGTSISQLVPTVSGTNPITFSVNPALPSGLSLNTATGVISGTPTVIQTTQNYTVTATNSLGSGTFVLSINIQAPPTNLSYGSDKVYTINTAITPVVPTVTANPAPTFSISPTLPTGLSFNTTTGAISGTPTVSQAAQNYTVTAANGIAPNAIVVFKITIASPPTNLTYAGDQIFTKNTAITAIVPTVNANPAPTYSVSPSLPSGLVLNMTTGAISGTPTAFQAAQTYTFTANNGAGSTTASFKISVQSAPILNYPQAGDYILNRNINPLTPVVSGTAPATFSINPPLPDGLVINSTTGVISGIAKVISEPSTYTISAINAIGVTTAEVFFGVDIDTDSDNIGDRLDSDDDSDGVLDLVDNCPLKANSDQADIDRDGKGDFCDLVELNISEVLTPNGDGVNDTWQIINVENNPRTTVHVFNRSGKEVFYSGNYKNDWNGHFSGYNEALPSGSYFYQIDLKGDGTIDAQGWLYITN